MIELRRRLRGFRPHTTGDIMKHAMLMAAAALALAGCSKSASRQFADMCDYQVEHDPQAYVTSKGLCIGSNPLNDSQKMEIVNAYNFLKQARVQTGVGEPQ